MMTQWCMACLSTFMIQKIYEEDVGFTYIYMIYSYIYIHTYIYIYK